MVCEVECVGWSVWDGECMRWRVSGGGCGVQGVLGGGCVKKYTGRGNACTGECVCR